MILSSMNIAPREIYRMYKDRCAIENFFGTWKNDLEAMPHTSGRTST